MASKRKLIRQEIFTLLENNISYDNKIIPINKNRKIPHLMKTLPQINIYILTETANFKDTNPKQYYRNANLSIEVIAEANFSINNDLIDNVTEQIEDILFNNPFLISDVSDDVIYSGFDTALDDNGNKVTSSSEMSWVVPYRTDAPRALDASQLNDFNVENTTYNMDDNENSQIKSETNL